MMKNLYVMNDSFCMKSKKADVCLTQEKLGSAVNKELELIYIMFTVAGITARSGKFC